MNELSVASVVVVDAPGQARPRSGDELRAAYARAWEAAYEGEHVALLRQWDGCRAPWLRRATRRSGSASTVRAYQHSLDMWFAFVQTDPWLIQEERREAYAQALRERGVGKGEYRAPWEVTDDDVQGFIALLGGRHQAFPWDKVYPGMKPGLAASSIGQAAAACSSFYSYVSGVKRLVSGMEVGLFCDRDGRPRGNPFHASNVSRPEISPYGKAFPLSLEQCQAMWTAATGGVDDPMDERDRAALMRPLQGQALLRQRDRALLKFALYSGRRASEIARLRWGDIDAGPSAGSWILRWKGKGGKSSVQALPTHVYWEIVCWLRAAERWPARAEDYVWQPLRMEQLRNLGLTIEAEGNRHISADQINKIVKKLARRAGLPEGMVHTHTLRHTFSNLLLETTGDVNLLQKTLGHESLMTTTIYANSPARQKPVDKYGAAFQQALGF